MKLYLSSYRLGENPKQLNDLFQKEKHIAVIMNAVDFVEPKLRTEKLKKELKELSSLGLIPEELDLREYFGKERMLKEKMKKFDGIWVRGGNVFILRRAMKYSGLDTILNLKRKNKNFVYSGYSAGICVLSPNLKGLEIMDYPLLIPEKYRREIIWKGLNILPYFIIPHYQSEHIETAGADEAVTYAEKNNVAYKTLRDGDVIITDSD